MSKVAITIPDGLTYADLKLSRDADGGVSFDTAVIERVREASGLSANALSTEDAIAGLLTTWYRAHLAEGGAPDPVQEELIAEARLEDERGGGYSHQPGRA